MARRFKPLHASLAVAGGLVGVLHTVIEIAMLAMFHPGEYCSLGGTVALQFIGNDHARHIQQSREELAEELLRGLLVPPAPHQDIQHISLLIDCPPQVVRLALNRQTHSIEVPLVPRSGTAAPELIGILLTKFAAPLTNGLIGHGYTTFQQ
jgi:hypothetical protein